MKRKRPPITVRIVRTANERLLTGFLVFFCAGALTDWCLRAFGPPLPADTAWRAARTITRRPLPASPVLPPGALAPEMPAGINPALTKLRVPIDGMDIEKLKGGFAETRSDHPHEAVDIMAPRYTPIHAVQDGEITHLFFSKAGGNTVYQYDPTGRFCYYYAHLQRYAEGLHGGEEVKQGDVIGYVGTSGNAPPNAPHLHFAVFEVTRGGRLGDEGRAIDPYVLFHDSLAH
jgi:murein DD-endopeptidase MepM/ murein hydrolase activator NlpD